MKVVMAMMGNKNSSPDDDSNFTSKDNDFK